MFWDLAADPWGPEERAAIARVMDSGRYTLGAEVAASMDGRSLWSLIGRKPRAPYIGLYRRRHPTVLIPRDFDLSPFFQIVKFNVVPQRGFDYSRIEWATDLTRDELDFEQPNQEAAD